MAAFIPQTSTAACPHSGKDIPTSNVDLHFVHCSRNLEKCSICGDMIPKKHASQHHDDNHTPVDCPICGQTVERENFDLHVGERCLRRFIACEYCAYHLPAIDLYEHQDLCGNRTEFCNVCSRYVRLCQWAEHELQAHSGPDAASESPRRLNRARSGTSRPSRAILTIIISGAAVVLVSILVRRRING